ncbi:interleukin-6 isoform X2 [Hyla sarda]|uniref:interleukin-6 isoform X2 n=1 Tax=Hyla sarda TaxID=327740 RepID=UPI0024C26882|nr:interleukin-6 isoform X2 [Hyla sarda]
MDCTSTTSSAWLLVYLAVTTMLPVVLSAPTSSSYAFGSPTRGGLENVANVLVTETGKLLAVICKKTPNLCRSSSEHLLRMDLKLPEINMESGCLSTKFNKEKCLPKIHSDLLRFQTYFDFLKESMPSNKNIIDFIQVKTISLADALKHLEENLSEDKQDTTGIAVDDLRSKDQWNQNLTSYIILQSFKEYMEKTVRAVRNSVNVSK